MFPQLGLGGCSERPRKLRPASPRMTPPKANDMATINGDRMLGRTRLNMIRRVGVPCERDASMKDSCVTASPDARTSRVKPGMSTIVNASAVWPTLGPSTPAIASASTSGGMLRSASMTRMARLSNHPPR